MAIWYTDFLTGNDTTGDGSIALPYKTINKAINVGLDGDEIRVAGSGFTALPGTCSHTSRTGTTWNTSQSLVGLLAPGDIITYNDPNFGDQKFFYKVFAVTATNFTTDGPTNFDENVNVTISKVTTQHYYTTLTNQTFESVNLTGKSQFTIRGGWTNNFTAQDGWTVMNYHSTSSATAISGTGFNAPSGPGLYADRFMISHLSTGFAGHINTWSPGTLAFVYMPTSSAVFGANPVTSTTYPNADLYLSNTRLSTFNSPQYAADGSPALKYDNCWFMRPALNVNATASVTQFGNMYTKGYALATITNFVPWPSAQTIIANLSISSFGTPANNVIEYVSMGEATPSPSNAIITNSINKVGLSANNIVLTGNSAAAGNITQLITPAQNIETGTATDSGWGGMNNQNQAPLSGYNRPIAIAKDIEGFKTIFGQGQVLFADPTEFSTGTNSLRISKGRVGTGINITPTPIEQIFVDSAAAKTITIRCKSSVAGNVTFAFVPNAKTGNCQTSSTQEWAAETHAVGATWTDITYTGLNAYNANLFVNSFVTLGINANTMPGKFIWIDSVTIS